MSSFPCTGCGSCCKRIEKVVQMMNVKDKNDPLYFPYEWDQDGVCEHLDKNTYRCKIYYKRPLICNVDRIAKYLNLDKGKFYELNISACNKMMDEDGVPLHFRIK
jgi:Fe-S-cluster containining protein